MLQTEITGVSEYLDGLTRMASACSEWIGPSYIVTDCYDRTGFASEFSERFGLADPVQIIPAQETLQQIFTQWLGESNQIAENLLYLIRCRLGEPVRVYRASEEEELIDALSACSHDGIGMFYIMEDICFAEFQEVMACFMLGNNE